MACTTVSSSHYHGLAISHIYRRHRVFAELIEQGTRSTLTIPSYLPASNSAASTVVAQPLDSQKSIVEMESLRNLGLNPTQALQHPGFYYFMAARCTENRRARFLAALEDEVRTKSVRRLTQSYLSHTSPRTMRLCPRPVLQTRTKWTISLLSLRCVILAAVQAVSHT